jgi:hypothetical protein
MTKKTRNWLIALCILAFPFVLFLGCLIFMKEPPPPLAPLPNPNGYDDLVKAGKMVAVNDTVNTTFYNEMGEAQLKEVILANAATLALARAGLSNQCRVPVQYSDAFISNHLGDLASLKRLAQALLAEGRLAELENRPSDAAKSYLDAIHLGDESARGGVLVDELVSIAIESIGTSPLQKLVPQLDANSCRETATALETLDARRQTSDEIMQQEDVWRKAFARLHKRSISKADDRSLKNVDQACKRKFDTQEQKTRQLLIALAARAYELDKGHPPARAADLVPEYLKAVPQDPVAGTNMVYSPR